MLPTNRKKRSVMSGSNSRPNAQPPELLEPLIGLATTPHANKRVRYGAGKTVVVKSDHKETAVESELSEALKLHKSMTTSALKQEDITRITSSIIGGEESVLVREITGFNLNNWSGLSFKSGRTTFTDFVSFSVKANNAWSRWAIPVLIEFGALASVDHLRAISTKKSSDMGYIETVLASLKRQGIAVPTDMVATAKTAEIRAAFEQHNQSPEVVNENAAAAAPVTITTTVDPEPEILAVSSSSADQLPLQNANHVEAKDSYEEKALAFLKVSEEL